MSLDVQVFEKVSATPSQPNEQEKHAATELLITCSTKVTASRSVYLVELMETARIFDVFYNHSHKIVSCLYFKCNHWIAKL